MLQLDGAKLIRDLVSKEIWVHVLKRFVEHVLQDIPLWGSLCVEKHPKVAVQGYQPKAMVLCVG